MEDCRLEDRSAPSTHPRGGAAPARPDGRPDTGFAEVSPAHILEAIQIHAREVLGLDDLDTLPGALPPRAEQLWRMDQFAANVPFSNPMFVPLGPQPDIGLLYEAVAIVVDRHEALRTRLILQNGRAIQVVEDWKASTIEVEDILQRDLADDRPDHKSAVTAFTQAPMDLFRQDSFHCRAFRDEKQNVTLGFHAHGFFSDAWSSQLLLHEVRGALAALTAGQTASFKPAAQYGEYARDQRRSLARNLDSHLTFWHRKLKDVPPSRLPYDHRRETGRRGRCYFFIGDEIATRLTVISRTNRVSLTLVLLAAYQLSLARWTGQSEILSAAYTADRVKPEFQNTVGFLVANMPVLGRVSRGGDFRSFLLDLAREFYGGYAHRELSCELYEAVFSPGKPFCSTVFNFVPLQKNFFASELHSVPSFDGIVTAPDASRPAIYREIYLGLAQYPNGLLGKLFYNADLFTPDGMAVFVRHFKTVIQKIAGDPDLKLQELAP